MSKKIPIHSIHPNPFQPRRDFDEDGLRALAESIQANGLIQPIKIVPAPGGGYHLLDDGERRLRAMRDVLGWEALEVGKHVLVVEPNGYGDADRLARALAANEQRAALNLIESAQALQRLHDMGLSDADIAQRLGKSRAWVANRRRLLQLPVEAQQAVASGELPERRARYLLQHLRAAGLLNAAGEAAQAEVQRLIGEYRETSYPQHLLPWGLSESRRIPWPPDTASAWDAAVACGRCPHHVARDDDAAYCALDRRADAPDRQACFPALRKRFAAAEVQRVSAETGIPALAEDEQAARITDKTARAFQRWIEEGADHLRLLTNPSGRTPWWYPNLGSDFVTVGTVKPHLLGEASKASRGYDWEQISAWREEAKARISQAIVDAIPAFVDAMPEPDSPVWEVIAAGVQYRPHLSGEAAERFHNTYGQEPPPRVVIAVSVMGDALNSVWGAPHERDAEARARDGLARLRRIVAPLGVHIPQDGEE